MTGARRRGATLVELLVVLAILAILAGVAVPAFPSATPSAPPTRVEAVRRARLAAQRAGRAVQVEVVAEGGALAITAWPSGLVFVDRATIGARGGAQGQEAAHAP